MTLAELAITVSLLAGLGLVASRLGLSAIPAYLFAGLRAKLARSLPKSGDGRAGREGVLPRPQEWEGARPDAQLTRRRRIVLELKTVDPGWLRITSLRWHPFPKPCSRAPLVYRRAATSFTR